jgi:YHS domain-containing protein
MTGLLVVSLLLAQAPRPEECLRASGDPVVESAVYAGKTYEFKRAGCKALFDSDPERFSQLFDALAELAASGQEVSPEQVSAVPS